MNIKLISVFLIGLALLLSACGKSDADLQKAATDKLTADKVVGATVAVKDGVATLSGEVADVTVKTKAESSVKAVDGIKSVNNQLSLKPLPTPVPAPADPMLKGKLDENLKKAGCTGVTVEVNAGTVTASGTVPDAKYAECIKILNESGLGKLDNKIVKGK